MTEREPSWEVTRLAYGLTARMSRFTFHLKLRDQNGQAILALTRNDQGLVVHRAPGVQDGAPLEAGS